MQSERLLLGNTGGRRIYLPHHHRQYHTHVIGAPGQGKSKFLEHMIRHDILAGHGLCLIDPHGSLYDDLVDWLAAIRLLDSPKVLLFEPDETLPHTFGFNPLNFDGLAPGDVADSIERMMNATAAAWGGEDQTQTPRLSRCLRLVLHTLWENQLTLAEAKLLCMKSPVQEYLASQVKDPERAFDWEYYNTLPQREYVQIFESTLNRLDAFSRHPLIRAMVSQTERVLEFRDCMDSGAVLLVNLAKLRNDENRRVIGTLLVNDIYSKGLQRKANESRPFFLYIDECYYCLNEDIERISIGLRKFGVWMTLAHHTLAQLRKAGESVYSSVMMIPNKVVFGGLEEEDAETMVPKLFLDQLNFEEPKHILDKPTVVGYGKRALYSYSHSHSSGYSSGSSTSHGETTAADAELVSQIVSELDSSSYSGSEAYSETRSETYVPELEVLPTAVYSPQEQIFRAMVTLIHQPTQYAVVRRYREKSVHVRTPWVESIPITREYIEARRNVAFERLAFTTPRALAERLADERKLQLSRQATNAGVREEPESILG